MTVCACPQGIIRPDCDYHQGVAQRFLENLNARPAWSLPGADPQSDLRASVAGGYRPDPPLITQHYRPGGYTPKEPRA